MHKLAESIAATEGLSLANWNGFELGDFLEYLTNAQPIDAVEMQANATIEANGTKKRSLWRLGLVAGGAMIMVSTIGIVLGTIGS